MTRIYGLLLVAALLLAGCSPARQISRLLRTQPAYTDHLMGVALYDPVRHKSLLQHQADRPFIPASNTKLVSFYAGLLFLPDSLPTIAYARRADSLLVWGLGNPLLLHPDLPDTSVLAFLRSQPGQLFLSPATYDGPRLGPGWAWDDYNDDYSVELASLPIYGNVVRFDSPDRQSAVYVRPRRFADSTQVVASMRTAEGIRRAEDRNQFRRAAAVRPFRQDVPFRWSAGLAAQLLSDTLHRPVGVIDRPKPADARIRRGSATDSLYRRMLHVSDNQFAEQVLLMASAERGDTKLDGAAIRRYLLDSVMRVPAGRAKWVDGSGLSRYNLFTPNTLIDLLTRIQARVPQQRLFSLLPAAGQSGTLRSMGSGPGTPYVWAKSGSMSGVYNLSGYIQTRRGRLLTFSIMNNNFTQPVGEMRRRTADLLRAIHEAF